MAHSTWQSIPGEEVGDLALYGMSKAIQGLGNILQQFRDIEEMTEPQLAARAGGGGPGNSRTSGLRVAAKPIGLVHLIAGTLRAKVESLVGGIRNDTEFLELLPPQPIAMVVPNDAASESGVLGASQACMPERDPKQAKRARMMGCRHYCKHHHEVVDPWLWSTLPLELVEIVFAKLPLRTIIALARGYEAWADLSAATNFRQFCAERHPKLFALVRWDAAAVECDTVRATVFDISSNEWVSFDLIGFPPSRRCNPDCVDYGYEDSRVAHDGGLVCFVPPYDLTVAPILVCNPLTGDMRRLPVLSKEHRLCHLVQILVDDNTKEYKIRLVCGRNRLEHEVHICINPAPDDTTYCYDSSTRQWSIVVTGYVYGCGRTLKPRYRAEAPAVFDCRTKVLYQLKYRIPESRLSQTESILGWSSVRNRMVILHDSTTISEFAWVGSKYSTHTTVELGPYNYKERRPHEVFIFASNNFYLVIGENSKKTHGKHDQLIQVYDRSAKTWHRASPVAADEALLLGTLHKAFMCELRWDAIP